MNTKIENKLTPVRIIAFVFVALWLIVAMFPFIWTLWGSFKVQADFFQKLTGQMQYLAFILKNKQVIFLLLMDIMALG